MAASKGIAPVTTQDQREHLAEVLQGKNALANADARLQEIQDQLLEQSLSVVQASVSFSEIEEASKAPPPEWIAELGEDRAWTRWRIAQASWRSAKDAPVGIKVAAQMAVGILKAKATEKAAPKTLNVALLNWPGQLPQYVEQDFERD